MPLSRVHLTLAQKIDMEKFGLPGCDRKKIAKKYGVSKPIINLSPIRFKTIDIQALETLRKFAEIDCASEMTICTYRSPNEFETVCL